MKLDFVSLFVFLAFSFFSACKTTSPVSSAAKTDTSPTKEDLPILTVESIDYVMLGRIADYGRADAQAIFGAKAFIHTIAFDSVMDSGPCRGVLGLRIVYANGDLANAASRPYAMVTLNPRVNGFGNCAYESASAIKSALDVDYLVREVRNFESEFENFSLVQLGIAQGIAKISEKHEKFGSVVGFSLVSPNVPGMAKNPWLLVVGESCGATALVYVNLTTGELLEGRRGVKGGC